MPRGGGAVAIVGADALGKANDKEVSGDAEEVTQRRPTADAARGEALRRRTVAKSLSVPGTHTTELG